VSLADEERAALESLVRKGKAAARKIAHARILLLADQGQDDEDIANALAISSRTIGASASVWSPKASSPPSTTNRNRRGHGASTTMAVRPLS
jgi:hypothetical protein